MADRAALDGVRVLEIASRAGAYAGKLLADMGAEVVLVEPPGGDPARADALSFWHYNGGKRCLELDLESEAGRARLRELAAGADVLLEAGVRRFPPLWLDDPIQSGASRRTPDLVHVAITPFGLDGPRRDWQSCDLVAQAAGGMAFVNGHPQEAPLAGLGLQAYHSASAYAAIAALLALWQRRRDGRGRRVDVSLQACVAATVEHASSFLQQTGAIEERRDTLHWSRTFRVGRCRDGRVLHCALGDWTSLLEWLKSDGAAQDLERPEWEEFAWRKEHCEHLFDVLDAWAAGYRVAELVEGAQLRRLPYAAVRSLAELARDPQLAARGFFVAAEHPELGRLRCPGAPYRLSATPWRLASGVRREAPLWISETIQSGASRRTPDGLPLAGIRVLDFTWVVAGPVATRILADQGAEVIKIERRDSLDYGSRRGGLTGNLNRGKQSVVLDMSHPEGLALARALIAQADVVIDNFSARVMPNWGLDWQSLHALNPRLIAVGMSGFGRTGPLRDQVSYGPTLQALAGFTAHMRHEGGEPAGWGFSYSDMAAGYSAALAVLMALWHRERSGEGQLVDLSQLESLAALIGAPLLEELARAPSDGGDAPCSSDSASALLASANRSFEGPAAPHGIYRCAERTKPGRARADRWCAIAVFDDATWRRFAAAIGSPAWSEDARFATAEARRRQRDELDARVSEWTSVHQAEEVAERLQAAGVAAAVVADADDLRRDPQLRRRGYWVELPTPEGERVVLDGVPFRIEGNAAGPAAPGPLLGEHTDAVLARVLGLDPDRIAALRAAGAVG